MKARVLLLSATASIAFASAANGGGTQPPVFGTSVEAVPVAGHVSFIAPGQSSAPLLMPQQLAVGSTVDATAGRVRIIAVDAAGATHSGEFYEGAFTIQQPVSEQGIVELMLAAPTPKCGGAAAARAPGGRHLGSNADPYYSPNASTARTKPKKRYHANDAAAVQTTWDTADGCAGGKLTTAVMATHGAVVVTNPKTHKPIAGAPVVRAGQAGCYSVVRIHATAGRGRFRTRGRYSTATVRGAADAHAAATGLRVSYACATVRG